MMGGLYVPRVGPYMCYNDVWIFTPNGITLALNPLSFHASRVGSDALLNWEYPGEKGIKGYQIQKLDEAATAYKSIGYQATKTTAGQHSIYTYTDLNLSSKATFYRLQLLHTNRDISYSETRHVPGLDQQDNITLFPNPSAGQVVNIRFTGGGVRDISLVDLNGVTRKRWFNYNSSLLQLYNLQPGTYMLQVVNKNNKLVKTRKIVVIK